MKQKLNLNKIIKLLAIVIISIVSIQSKAQKTNPLYDSILAKSLGADDYGMKNYILVILKTGSANIIDKKIKDSLFAGHFKNMNDLSAKGKLIVAGPFKTNENKFRGLFILAVKTIEEAKQLVNNDSCVKEKLFEVEYYEWYGSAALPEYLKLHEKIEKKSF